MKGKDRQEDPYSPDYAARLPASCVYCWRDIWSTARSVCPRCKLQHARETMKGWIP